MRETIRSCGNGQGKRDILESDDVVTNLDVGDALTNGLDNTGTLVSKDNGESTLGVLARECVGIW